MLLVVDGAASGHPASVSLYKRLTRKKRGDCMVSRYIFRQTAMRGLRGCGIGRHQCLRGPHYLIQSCCGLIFRLNPAAKLIILFQFNNCRSQKFSRQPLPIRIAISSLRFANCDSGFYERVCPAVMGWTAGQISFLYRGGWPVWRSGCDRLHLDQAGVDAAECEEFVVGTPLHDASFAQHAYLRGVADGG